MNKNSIYAIPFLRFRGKTYLKQAWNLIKQEKLFSAIYIFGTGLSIMTVMVLAITFYLKTGNIYPETNRNRMLVISRLMEVTENSTSISNLSYPFIETTLLSLKNPATVTAVLTSWEEQSVEAGKEKGKIPVTTKHVDTNFWKVFSFHFIDGKPFTEADYRSEIKTAVIAGSLAHKLFGTTRVTGKFVTLHAMPYRICGVVKDASFITPETFAHLWVPHTTADRKNFYGVSGGLGPFTAYLSVPSPGKLNDTKNEILENIQKFDSSHTDAEFSIGGPDKYWQLALRGSRMKPDFTKEITGYGLAILVLLLIPAVSLAGMIESRMERRLAETGIRRAFGASTHTLINQIITENFVFTGIGGIMGLLFSYAIFIAGKEWIMQIGKSIIGSPPKGTEIIIYPDMLFNINVFAIALFISFLLNILCSLLPAWRASRREIIYSLNAK